MGIEYTEPHVMVAAYPVTFDMVDTEIVVSLGLLPTGTILAVDVDKTTPFNNGAAIRLNTNGATTENVGSAAEIDAGTEGTASCAAWRSVVLSGHALNGLVRSGVQELYAYLTGGAPTAGALNVYVRYLPVDLGY